MAGKGAYWESRRDASAFEPARPEAVHVFGTDRMSSEDLLRYFLPAEGAAAVGTPPLWVEWVNDSSANVVFSDEAAAYFALEATTVPLLPSHIGIDTASWRTFPVERALSGKSSGDVRGVSFERRENTGESADDHHPDGCPDEGRVIGERLHDDPGLVPDHHRGH